MTTRNLLSLARRFCVQLAAILAMGSAALAQTSSGNSTERLVIWPLGDSITQGAGAPGGYRDPLHKLLTDAGYNAAFVGSYAIASTPSLEASGNAFHDGHGSFPAFVMLEDIDGLAKPTKPQTPKTHNGGSWLTGTSSRPAIHPDIVLLMAGTNDLGMFERGAQETLEAYDRLLEKIFTLRPKTTVICATLAPYNGPMKSGPRDYSKREAKQLEFNAGLPALVAKHKAAGRRVFLCDMRQKFPASSAGALLTNDGVHPNQDGYNAIAASWFEVIKTAFPRPAK